MSQVKCACESCICQVNTDQAIERNGHYYCSDACAEGHPSGKGCGNQGCECEH
jgi:hypothetical protein